MNDAQPGPARFDPALDAWVLSRHEDARAALCDARLAAIGSSAPPDTADVAVHRAMARMLSANRLRAWRPRFVESALERAAALPAGRPVDLLASFAAPWALSVALTVTGASADAAPDLAQLARAVFLAGASRTAAGDDLAAHAAAAELARRLPPAEATATVQAFVALSQTLPHLLAGAWLELFRQPALALRLRKEPALRRRALEELLRLAAPAHAVLRYALADVRIGDAHIQRGDRVVLMLAAANRDPNRFPEPDRLDPERAARDHLAFGAGAHACAGARLVRTAATIATDALLRTTASVELTGPVTWIEGLAIRAPASLPAVLQRELPAPPSGRPAAARAATETPRDS